MGRGLFVAFEGIDRVGKSTQVKLLKDRMNDYDLTARAIYFPDRTSGTGKELHAYLSQTQEIDLVRVHQLFSQNRWECAPAIEELLVSGIHVIVDRYAYSGVAYSLAQGMDYDLCLVADTGLIAPDVVIFLDLPPSVAKERGNYGRERYEEVSLREKVLQAFVKIRSSLDHTNGVWIVIDADASIDTIADHIWFQILRKLSRPQDKIKRLW